MSPPRSKPNYRTKNVNEINWPELGQQLGGEAVTFAVDVAKAQQYALLTNAGQTLSTLVKWELLETTALIQGLQQLGCPVTVVMESTGTYGDAMRHQFRQAGFALWQASAKRVHTTPKKYLMACPACTMPKPLALRPSCIRKA